MTSATANGQESLELLQRPLPWTQRLRERIVEFALLCCGLLSILVTIGIAYAVLYGSYVFFTTHNGAAMSWQETWDRVVYFFTGTTWSAAFDNPKYGILPLLLGTLWVTVIAALIALPIGLATAIYLSEYASPRTRAIAKPTLELLAGIPTVVYGFFALTTVTPLLALVIPDLEGHNQLAGGIVVGIMVIPMVSSLSEDSLRAVPRSLRDGAYALGATKFETSTTVVVPAALSGIAASFLLAISRAIGETMAVALACGEKSKLILDPRDGAATMTGFIVRIAKGDVEFGTTDYNSLFAVAGVLFFLTLFINLIAQRVIGRFRMVYQ